MGGLLECWCIHRCSAVYTLHTLWVHVEVSVSAGVGIFIHSTQPTLHTILALYSFSTHSTQVPFHTLHNFYTLHNSHTCRILRCSLSNCDVNTRRCVHGAGSWHRWVWAYASVSVSWWDVHNPLPRHTAETYMTAYSGLFWSGRLTQGETVLIHAVQWTCTVFILYSICTVLLLYQYWCVCIVFVLYIYWWGNLMQYLCVSETTLVLHHSWCFTTSCVTSLFWVAHQSVFHNFLPNIMNILLAVQDKINFICGLYILSLVVECFFYSL